MPDQSIAQFAVAGLLTLSIATAPAVAQAQAIEVTNAWARATVPAQKTAGAYLDIRSRDAARLVGVLSPQADVSEIHHTVHEGGVVKMQPVKAIDLPPGQTVRLAPGGYHIMLVGLRSQLKRGDSLPLTLRVAGADGKLREIEVKVEVREPTATDGKSTHRH